MIAPTLIIATLFMPVGGDLPAPVPSPRTFVKVDGIQAPFWLAPRTLSRYGLGSGDTISPALAREIMHEHGVDYPPEILHRLNELEGRP